MLANLYNSEAALSKRGVFTTRVLLASGMVA